MLNIKLDNWVISKLAEPFPEEDVKWLPAFGIKEPGKPTPVLAYVDARMVVNRLNEVVGAENWSDSYREVIITTEKEGKDKAVATLAGIECTLTILGVSKTDVGTISFSDEVKGAYSDALKRAAVKFGVGEYFYGMGTKFAKYDQYKNLTERPRLGEENLPSGSDPDSVIEPLYQKYRNNDDDRVQEAIKAISVMGQYDFNAPLVVKRAVYEVLAALE